MVVAVSSLAEMAAEVREIESRQPDVLAQFDAVFARQPLDPRKVTMESALSAMRPTVIPKENE